MTDNQRRRAELNKLHNELKKSKQLLQKLETNTNPKTKNKFQIDTISLKILEIEQKIKRFTNPWLDYRSGVFWIKLTKSAPFCIGVSNISHLEHSIRIELIHFHTGKPIEQYMEITLGDIEYLVPENNIGFL